jgi:hypothetical protein
MSTIIKAWVTKKTRADGKVYYTAHIKERNWFLRFIPIIHTKDLVRLTWNQGELNEYYTFALWYSTSNGDAHKFKIKMEAEAQLMDIVDQEIDRYNKQKNRKVIKEEDFPITDI